MGYNTHIKMGEIAHFLAGQCLSVYHGGAYCKKTL